MPVPPQSTHILPSWVLSAIVPEPLQVGQSCSVSSNGAVEGATPISLIAATYCLAVSPTLGDLPDAMQSGQSRLPAMILPVPSQVAQSLRSSSAFTASASMPLSIRIGNPLAPLPTPSTREGSNSSISVMVVSILGIF